MVNHKLFLGLVAIFIYHLYQVTLLRDLEGCSLEESSVNHDFNAIEQSTIQTNLIGRKSQYIPRTVRQNHTCWRMNISYDFPQIPDFIVIGTQKGGTSALSALLDQHPWIESSYYFEPHFFDFNEVMLYYKHQLDDPEAMCKVLRTYLLRNFNLKRLWKYPYLLAFEKTPAYILTPNAPNRIKAVVPWSKIVVTLRNPVDRLISQHAMTVMRWWDNRTFQEALADDLNVMRHEGFWLPSDDPLNSSHLGPPNLKLLRKYRTEGMLYRGMYARQLIPWLKHYVYGESLFVVRYEELKNNPGKVLNEVVSLLGAPHYDFPHDVLVRNYSPKRSSWRTDYKPNVPPEAVDFLNRFYKPYNDELADLLGEKWRDVWS